MTEAALRSTLAGLRSRGEIKALGERAEREPALWQALVALVEARGAEVEPGMSGKSLVRLALNRAEGAQVVGTPTRRDEEFTCLACGELVPRGGARVRDHCPHCLRGLHVDVVPGDRASTCRGRLEPIDLEMAGRDGVIIYWRCARCAHLYRGRAHPDDRLPEGLQLGRLRTVPPAEEAAPAEVEEARALPLRMLQQIREQGMWGPGERVLVAVSGGQDSMVLLEALAQTARGHGGRLEVASVDHGLRPEAAAELELVAERAQALGLPFHALRLGLEPGPELAARAREARRAALLGLGAARVATAHHQDDQAETVLQRLLCGAGALGLSAMRPLDPPWCRPLLQEERATIAAYARARGLRWAEDPSNPGSQRGRLRTLLPELYALHGGGSAALARSARLLAREDALLERLAAEALPALSLGRGLDLVQLRALDPALQLRALRRWCLDQGQPVRGEPLEAFLRWGAPEGGRLGLPGAAVLRSEGGRLVLEEG